MIKLSLRTELEKTYGGPLEVKDFKLHALTFREAVITVTVQAVGGPLDGKEPFTAYIEIGP